MSSQQFPRLGAPTAGLGSLPAAMPSSSTVAGIVPGLPQSTVSGDDTNRDMEHVPRESGTTAATLSSRDEKQETVVVRPYPQVQSHTQLTALSQHSSLPSGSSVPITAPQPPSHLAQAMSLPFPESLLKPTLKATIQSRPIAPAPSSGQTHVSAQSKLQGHMTVTMESAMPQASAIPVATISGQQGHPSGLHHLMATNVQMSIIRSGTPASQLHIGASHLPRGAAAAAMMSNTKVTTVLRPASAHIPGAAAAQPTMQHIIHQPIQSRPPVSTSATVPAAVVATVSATRAQSPVITSTTTHATETALRSAVSLQQHAPQAAIGIQRSAPPRDAATRITLPSHPAMAAQKPQLHTVAQKTIFSTGTPVAAATVAPILATNTIPSSTTAGSVSHTQVTTSTIVTMTVPSHSPHVTTVTTSNIPVEWTIYFPFLKSLAQVKLTGRNDHVSRQTVPFQLQYFLPTYQPTAYPLTPLTHAYTPITSSVSTIRPYPAQAVSSPITAQTSVGVASTVHLNPMQLMTVDASHARHIQGIQPASVGTQSIQPAPIGAQAMQPAALGTQTMQTATLSAQGMQMATLSAQGMQAAQVGTSSLHTATSISTQNIQPSPVNSQQPQVDPKTSVLLADGPTLVTNSINSTFSSVSAPATVAPTHTQNTSTSAPAQGSSPRPSILRKKPATDGLAVRKSLIPPQPSEASSPRVETTMRNASGSPRPAGVKPKPEIHVSIAAPVSMCVEGITSQTIEQPTVAVTPTTQQPPQVIPAVVAAASPQPCVTPTVIPASVPTTPPTPCTVASTIAPLIQAMVSSAPPNTLPTTGLEVKVKEEVEPMEITQPVTVSAVPSLTSAASPALTSLPNSLTLPPGELPPGASPRKKPRKQQHVISTEEGDMMETNSTDDEKSNQKPAVVKVEKRKSPPKEYIDEEGVRYVPVRPRPPITLLRHYRNPWKAAYHHFQRYSDVRVKEEKKTTLQEIANQKGIACRAQGWKVHLCAAQLLQLTSLEHDVFTRLSALQEGIVPKKKAASDDDLHRINELIQGNMQRCKLVMDQISEARDAMLKVLDHKERVLKLLNKNGTMKKVPKLKRKEKV
ncbi:histone deacetylase complex subunit SAP130 [Protopterus annectens]|uniref:histone deacetylase complex subunit SAP130 n=1 Tax=Protopterus annectens TaxID=7888 RepID=UPI001CFB67E3|nr:histone deacetylase complex subunit SAP130 [Protopterus annectens]